MQERWRCCKCGDSNLDLHVEVRSPLHNLHVDGTSSKRSWGFIYSFLPLGTGSDHETAIDFKTIIKIFDKSFSKRKGPVCISWTKIYFWEFVIGTYIQR